MSRDKMIPPQPPTEETPWQRFEQFAKKIITAKPKPDGKKRRRRSPPRG